MKKCLMVCLKVVAVIVGILLIPTVYALGYLNGAGGFDDDFEEYEGAEGYYGQEGVDEE